LAAHVIQRPAARRDFITHYIYLAENASLDVAKRFRRSVQQTYEDLASMPEIGSAQRLREGRHAGIRLWPVQDFGNYLIAYKTDGRRIAIERLFHAKQDYMRVLDQ
jgi:toxin ParE1/3/4